MSVFIYQTDAFSKMVLVEGPEFIRQTDCITSSDACSFWRFFDEWNMLIARDPELLGSKMFLLIGWNPSIYGLGGWTRYHVSYTGEIFFNKDFVCGDYAELARRVGFRIWPDDREV